MDDEFDSYESRSIMPERMNEDPVVFNGCTLAETLSIVCGSFGFWLVAGGMIGLLLGIPWAMLGAVLIFTGLSSLSLTELLRRVKKNRPRGFFAQTTSLRLERWKLGESYLFQGSGQLDLGRTQQYFSPRRRYRDLQEGERGYGQR